MSGNERGHILTIAHSDDHVPGEQDDYDFTVECLAPALCGGWETCAGDHTIGSAEPSPYEDEDCPEELEFHGVEHTYRSDYGWTVPFKGCIVSDHVGQWDNGEWEIAREHGVGRHVVDDDWDDASMTLLHVETLPAQEDS